MRALRLLTALLVVAVAMLALAASADAHVTVSAPGAVAGGSDQEITFRVPVEAKSATVALTVALPTDRPIASVMVAPMPGWTHSHKTVTLKKPIVTDDGRITSAVAQITWRAEAGHGIEPGEYGSFSILAGQLPDAPSITFRALQTYADGTVVRWNQVAAPGSSDEPQNPAPVLELGAADDTPTRSTEHSSNAVPVTLSAIALVIGLMALGLAVLNRTRRSAQRS